MSRLPAISCCGPLAAPMSAGEAGATARLFKALADPARVKIVNLLATSEAPICTCNLTGPLGLSQPTVSHPLKKLTDAGLLVREQRGVWGYYSIDPGAAVRLRAVVELGKEQSHERPAA
jgi:ArsR family transcriptional regulator